ncbi:formyltetrahydrofolate deformylase [Cellulomonas sp. zg-ZUI222]|uniref:Formyltetrahydrofolate deformylase n=1 Tax=Cellulomonas wangleii TaxID=2816956 RepID=A0ABX8D1G9_9CELL|nr:formyltetrahydrofolate deformylase [Cellulomonas wangleii]MBO0922933.1 formyltetrahydrofolate deformylase [Cellulomonas wangleii]QVI61329.1 formyltetrahydrofolate deformylase [Cellulomonas wangleii]
MVSARGARALLSDLVSSTSPVDPTHLVLTLSCPDRPGIVAAVAGLLAEHGGNITESQQFGDPLSGLFFMRVQVTTDVPVTQLRADLTRLAARFEMAWQLDVAGRPVRTLVMVSTTAHCLNDLAFRQRSEALPIDLVAVVSNHDLLRPMADFYGIPFHHVPVTAATKAAAEEQLLALVEELDVELVVLARYMQILSDDLCRRLQGRVINIHHSFLPSFKGARPYAQAHQRGVKLIGATAHYVTGDLDEGPIIEQDVERVDHTHAVQDLVALGQDVERRALARAVRWHAEHRVLLDGNRTIVFR